jgi:hypothetical protein
VAAAGQTAELISATLVFGKYTNTQGACKYRAILGGDNMVLIGEYADKSPHMVVNKG